MRWFHTGGTTGTHFWDEGEIRNTEGTGGSCNPKWKCCFPGDTECSASTQPAEWKWGRSRQFARIPPESTHVGKRFHSLPWKFFLTITAFDYLCKGTSAWSVEGGFSSFPCLMTSWARPRWGNVCFPEEHKRLIVRINDMNQLVSSRSPPWGKDNVSVRKRRKTWGVWWNNRSKRAERHAEMDPDAPLGSIKWWWRSCLLPNIDSWVNVTLESWAHQMMQLRDKEVCKSMQGTIGSIDWLQVGHPARWKPAFDLQECASRWTIRGGDKLRGRREVLARILWSRGQNKHVPSGPGEPSHMTTDSWRYFTKTQTPVDVPPGLNHVAQSQSSQHALFCVPSELKSTFFSWPVAKPNSHCYLAVQLG